MNAKEAIKTALNVNHSILNTYLSDLSDADLLIRPVPGANTIAWQLGHLITVERNALQQVDGAALADLPAGFGDKYNKETAKSESTQGFPTKAEYHSLYNKVREATLAALEQVSEADLDKKTTGNIARIAPTIGALFLLMANHEVMHGGQFVVVRRKLGKPILI